MLAFINTTLELVPKLLTIDMEQHLVRIIFNTVVLKFSKLFTLLR
jgi:MarR-like DNA-binding transcriptional regulator SgrR of sgrS sRNA